MAPLSRLAAASRGGSAGCLTYDVPMAASIALVGLLSASPLLATYSVVGVDTVRAEVGGAATSCIEGFSVSLVYAAVPGVGVVHAQALLNEQARDEAARLLGEGTAAPAVLEAITAPAFDVSFAQRQYLVATFDEAVAFTGAGATNYAGDRMGEVAGIHYALAGNILTGAPVLDRAQAAFTGDGCDLAERLTQALEAGAEMGEGDSRCTPDRPSTAAYLRIEGDEAESPRLEIDVVDSLDPLGELRGELDAWRVEHPCPAPEPPAGENGGGGATPTPPPAQPPPSSGSEGGCALTDADDRAPWALVLLVLALMTGWRRTWAQGGGAP